jgi:glycerol-3-phosphate acyltransferase PlsY
MVPVVIVLVLIPLAYLIGTFPSAELVVGAAGRDVTREGSGNPGASNAFRLLGWKVGLAVLFLDVAKGALAGGGGALLDDHRGAYILGSAAVLGHIFPVMRRFRGGRGVATGAGALAVIFPLVSLVLIGVWLAVARGLHKASVASMVCAVLFPIVVALHGGGILDVSVTTGLALVVIARHFTNLRRLVRGEEHGIAPRVADPDADTAAGSAAG